MSQNGIPQIRPSKIFPHISARPSKIFPPEFHKPVHLKYFRTHYAQPKVDSAISCLGITPKVDARPAEGISMCTKYNILDETLRVKFSRVAWFHQLQLYLHLEEGGRVHDGTQERQS
jgi:hypothetical protein